MYSLIIFFTFTMSIGYFFKKNKSLTNISVTNNKAVKYVNQALQKIQGEMGRNLIGMGEGL